jgi:lipoprotein NlpI
MKSFRRAAGAHFLITKRNEEILDELKVAADDDKLRRYKTYWLRHVTRRNSSRMARTVLNGRANGRTKATWKAFEETIGCG